MKINAHYCWLFLKILYWQYLLHWKMLTSSVERSICEQGIFLLKSLSSCTSSVLAVFRVYCKDAFKHSAFKTLLRPHQKYPFLEIFSPFSPGAPNLLNNSNSQCQGPISYQRNHLTIHRKYPALCSKIHASWSEPVASCLLISSCSLTVTHCKQDKCQHLTHQSPFPKYQRP